MRRAFQQTGLMCVLLVMPAADVRAQSELDHIPLILLPVIAPDSYPRSGTLAEVHTWIYEEFTRIAVDRDRGRMPAPPRVPGGFCHTISVSPTSQALPISEWCALARRVTTELSSADVETRRAGVNMASTLQQVACFGDPPLRGLFSPALLAALADRVRDPDPKIRGYAANLIAGGTTRDDRGRPSRTRWFDPLPILLAAIDDPDPGARRQMVWAIQSIGIGPDRFGKNAEAVVRALLGLADDPDRMTRLVAIHAIGFAGDAAVPAIPRLIEWLGCLDDVKRRSAARALAELGPLAAPAVPALAAMLRSEDLGDRYSALHTLRRMGTAAAPAVPAIAALLNDTDLSTTDLATFALTHIGPAARTAVPQLRDLATRSDDQYRRETNRAIDIIEGRRAYDDSPPRLPNPD